MRYTKIDFLPRYSRSNYDCYVKEQNRPCVPFSRVQPRRRSQGGLLTRTIFRKIYFTPGPVIICY